MSTTFECLLDDAISEIHRRDSNYLSRFPICFSDLKEAARRSANHPICRTYSLDSVERALKAGFAHLAAAKVCDDQGDQVEDELGRWVCDAIVDAYCTETGALSLHPTCVGGGTPSAVLAAGYLERHTPRGLRYFARDGGTRPLLLVNATGTPLEIWQRFLADTLHDWRIIVPERRGGDLLSGGLRQHIDLQCEAEDLAAILDAEQASDAVILGWCNGARLALDLARRCEERISSVVLLTPMLKGIDGIPPNLSPFERDLQPILDAVAKQPELGSVLARTIASQSRATNWERLKDPVDRVQTLFGLPPSALAPGLLAPITEAQSLINVSRRVASDEAYPMKELLSALRTPVLLIFGTHDQVVSNAFTSSVMRLSRSSILYAHVSGAGHYIQDLQYPYLRLLLNTWAGDAQRPPSTARMKILADDATGIKC